MWKFAVKYVLSFEILYKIFLFFPKFENIFYLNLFICVLEEGPIVLFFEVKVVIIFSDKVLFPFVRDLKSN